MLENARRRCVDGLSADYLTYSLLGYAAYAAYTGALHFSPGVQAAYMAAHGGSAPDVQLTDFLFASHALLVTLYTLYQCWLYGGHSSSSTSPAPALATSRVCNLTAAGVLAAVAAYCGHIGGTCSGTNCDAWLPLLSLLGGVKVFMTLIKYTPQALLNAERRSTDGWNINNVLLDLSGGVLSFAQVRVRMLVAGGRGWGVSAGSRALCACMHPAVACAACTREERVCERPLAHHLHPCAGSPQRLGAWRPQRHHRQPRQALHCGVFGVV